MVKELKIAELASLWGVSVPTTWNRIKKMGLTTFIKKNESNKDITFVSISDEQIHSYVLNVNNNINNANNNRYYEDMLTNNNVNNASNDVIDVDYSHQSQSFSTNIVSDIKEVYNDCNERILTINNYYNEQVKNLYEEIANYKAHKLMLEDKASREGLYIKEINELKADNNSVKKVNEWLKYIIVGLIMIIIGFIMYLIMFNNLQKDVNTDNEIVKQVQVKEVVNTPAPKPTKPIPKSSKR